MRDEPQCGGDGRNAAAVSAAANARPKYGKAQSKALIELQEKRNCMSWEQPHAKVDVHTTWTSNPQEVATTKMDDTSAKQLRHMSTMLANSEGLCTNYHVMANFWMFGLVRQQGRNFHVVITKDMWDDFSEELFS